MRLTERIIGTIFNKSIISNKSRIAKNAFRFTLTCDSISNFNYKAGHHLRFYIGINSNYSLLDILRTYSIWCIDQTKNTVDIVICTHTNGPGSSWALEAKVGDVVFFSNPKGKFTLDHSADNYFFIGDSSALAHLYAIQRNLPSDKAVKGIIYSYNTQNLFADIDGNYPFDFYELAENPVEKVLDILKDIIVKDASNMIYVGGDGRLCIALNRYFRKELKWSRKKIKTKPFWIPNKKGLE